MGYNNDQFYNIGIAGPLDGGGDISTVDGVKWATGRDRQNHFHGDADNPRFIYPERAVRTHPINRTGEENYSIEEYVLKRGYVRSIPRVPGEHVSKCQFQFNPQVLTQEVSMSESLLNFYQQDPGQFAQPLAGQTAMNFTILFDRSMEVNNQLFASRSDPSLDGKTLNPWEHNSPHQVGVLRDVAALFATIGQGVNQSDIDARYEEILDSVYSEQVGAINEGDETATEENYNKAVGNIKKLMEMNVGNYSLLIPKPIRLMFSSLYMIEGFATSSSVSFTKFNQAFVPIQAVIQLTVQAQHVGFATENTFVTYALEEARKAELAFNEAAEDTAREPYVPAMEDLSNWEMSMLDGWDAVTPLFPVDFTDSIDSASYPVDYIQQMLLKADYGDKLNEVQKLFEDGSNTTLQVSANARLYTDLDGSAHTDLSSGNLIMQHRLEQRTFNTLRSFLTEVWQEADQTRYLVSDWDKYDKHPDSATFFVNCKCIFEIDIKLTTDGHTFQGKGYGTVDVPTDENGYLNTPLRTSVRVNWKDDLGEETTPVPTPSPEPNEPSTVGGEITRPLF